MKRISHLLLLSIFLASCGNAATPIPNVTVTSKVTVTYTPVPTSIPTEVPPTPTETPDPNAPPDYTRHVGDTYYKDVINAATQEKETYTWTVVKDGFSGAEVFHGWTISHIKNPTFNGGIHLGDGNYKYVSMRFSVKDGMTAPFLSHLNSNTASIFPNVFIGKLADRYKRDKPSSSIQDDLDNGNISIPVIDEETNTEFELAITDKTVVNVFLAESGDFVPDFDVEGRQSRTTFETDADGNISIVNIIVSTDMSLTTLEPMRFIDLILGPFFRIIANKDLSQKTYLNSAYSTKIWGISGELARTAVRKSDAYFIIDDTP